MADGGVYALRQVADELAQAGGLQATGDAVAVDLVDGLTERDVAGDAVVEHDDMLADEGELATQGG